ncbi:alanine racemase [Balneolaceae bacterium ANBcel3]|nr:alanine racemase [Balneolaceae bacterium ANBcel3]
MSVYSFNHSHVEVYEDRLRDNAEFLHRNIKPEVKSMAVIKANAYGHGAEAAARALDEYYAMFAVANVSEAVSLRLSGIKKPVLVFGVPCPEVARAYAEYGLTAVVSAPEHFTLLEKGTPYHLKVDTGMGRLGFSCHELEYVQNEIKKYSWLNCEGIMTHFATADEADSALLKKQKSRLDDIVSVFGGKYPIHAANSAASLYHPECHHQYVRHGIALYGYDPVTSMPDALKPVMVWKSRVAQSKRIQKGDTVSYRAAWSAPEDGYISVIPVGYADGYRRNLSGKMSIEVEGTWYPQVGMVTMDYIMIWTGSKQISAGVQATIMGGEKNHAGHWAAALETIPYEICCGIAEKVPRIWKC